MKKISLEQLLRESGEEAYPEQYRYICRRIEARELIPVKKSPLNGKKPALHLSYWLAEEEPDFWEEIEELKFRMSPAIRTDYYLKHPEVYREEAVWVRMLNRYFLEQEERKGEDCIEPALVSLNERSFQIWSREKFLQREQGRKILAHCGVELGQLHVYGTTEPLAYYSCTRRVPQNVLILENKDTFYSMRRYLSGDWQNESAAGAEAIPSGGFGQAEEQGLSGKCIQVRDVSHPGIGVEAGTESMEAGGVWQKTERARSAWDVCTQSESDSYESDSHENDSLESGSQESRDASGGMPRRIFGREIGTVIYGAGKGILRSFEDFRFCVEAHVNAPENEILYFGDLDYEGIGIYERLAELFGADEKRCEIKPFTQAYEKMLDKAGLRGMELLPDTSEKQNRNLSGLFFRYFTESAEARMKQVLEAGKYIPQEIINITDF